MSAKGAEKMSRVAIKMFSSWWGSAGLREGARAGALSPTGAVLTHESLDLGNVHRVLGGFLTAGVAERLGQWPFIKGDETVPAY